MDEIGLPGFFLLFAVVLLLALFWLIGNMARARGHSPWPWWILAVFWSPFGSIIILWLFFPVEEAG